MRVHKAGTLPVEMPKNWQITLTCQVCSAELVAQREDLNLEKWIAHAGYKGVRYYYAYIICPLCDAHIAIPRAAAHPVLLKGWERQFGFDGYFIPNKRTIVTGRW